MSEALASTHADALLLSNGGLLAREPAREGSRKEIPTGARFLVFLVCLGAFAATVGASVVDGTRATSWTTFFVLAAAAATAQLFGVHTTHNQSYPLAIVFVLAGALLLPPELVALLCVIQHVPEWLKERYPFEIQGINIANYTLAALGAFAGARLVLGWADTGANSRTALAGIVGGAVFVSVNHVVLAGMLRVARGHSLSESRLFTFESLTTDLVLAAIGVGLAAWWNANLWFLPIAIAPLLLVHRALTIPRLRAEASRDAKTGLYNAGHLNSTLTDEMQRAARFLRPLSVIVADLDLLRKINNSYGHLSGDAVLQGVANVLREQIRPYDVAARFGGEEFAIILPETEFDEAMAIAERIRFAVEDQPFRRHGSDDPVPATLSLGVASFPVHAHDSDELVHQADLALYSAKALGRNRVCGATAETRTLSKLIQSTGRADQPAEPQVRGFRPYGVDRVVDDTPGTITRRLEQVRELLARAGRAVAGASPRAAARGADRRVRTLIAGLLLAAGALLALNAVKLDDTIASEPLAVGGFALVVLGLQLLSVDLYGSGAEAASAIGILAAGFVLGPPVAIAIAVLAAFTQWVRKQGLFHRALFDIANFALSAGAAAYIYHAVADSSESVGLRLTGAVAATIAYKAINSGLLCLVMSLAESIPFHAVWNERFRWAGLHYLAFGPLAFASALAYEEMGLIGLAAFAVPPALLTISVRQYLGHTRDSVEEVRRANEELKQSNADLAESNQRVRKTHLATIAALSRSMEAKDHYTGGHTARVASVAVALAHKLGYRSDELEAIEIGGLLHDIGKIGIPESMINKASSLNEEEWVKMREHPVISDYILSEVDFLHPFVRQVARWSHERIDGQGYPDGLPGNEIPLPARIMLVADAFDALTTDRPYRDARSDAAALDELREHTGTQFCPLVVEALESIWHEAPHLLGHGDSLSDVAYVA